MTDVERFLERFAAFGATPDPALYEGLFDPADGTVLHPGMEAPLHRDKVRDYMTLFLATIQEFHFDIVRWATDGEAVFVEAANRGVIGGERLEWGTIYRIVLRGDRVLAGRAYGDRVPLLARLSPTMTLAEAAGMGSVAPGLATTTD